MRMVCQSSHNLVFLSFVSALRLVLFVITVLRTANLYHCTLGTITSTNALTAWTHCSSNHSRNSPLQYLSYYLSVLTHYLEQSRSSFTLNVFQLRSSPPGKSRLLLPQHHLALNGNTTSHFPAFLIPTRVYSPKHFSMFNIPNNSHYSLTLLTLTFHCTEPFANSSSPTNALWVQITIEFHSSPLRGSNTFLFISNASAFITIKVIKLFFCPHQPSLVTQYFT